MCFEISFTELDESGIRLNTVTVSLEIDTIRFEDCSHGQTA